MDAGCYRGWASEHLARHLWETCVAHAGLWRSRRRSGLEPVAAEVVRSPA